GVEVGLMFRRIAIDVSTQTFGRQRPETVIDVLPEYYLNQTDRIAWEKVKDTGDANAIREFVARFPGSGLVAQAQASLTRLDRVERERQNERLTARNENAELRNKLALLEREKSDTAAQAEREAAERARARAEADRLLVEQARLARLESERRAEEA